MATRFLTLADVAETLNLTMSATRALVSSGELPAIQVGGKHVWRIEESVLEQFIQDQYTATRDARRPNALSSRVTIAGQAHGVDEAPPAPATRSARTHHRDRHSRWPHH